MPFSKRSTTDRVLPDSRERFDVLPGTAGTSPRRRGLSMEQKERVGSLLAVAEPALAAALRSKLEEDRLIKKRKVPMGAAQKKLLRQVMRIHDLSFKELAEMPLKRLAFIIERRAKAEMKRYRSNVLAQLTGYSVMTQRRIILEECDRYYERRLKDRIQWIDQKAEAQGVKAVLWKGERDLTEPKRRASRKGVREL